MANGKQSIVLSVVSHYQADLIENLLRSIEAVCDTENIKVILTVNIQDDVTPNSSGYSFPIDTIVNLSPKGFGANHNAAFDVSDGDYFCVINPDCIFTEDPFPKLLDVLESENDIGVITPKVINHSGIVQDNARKFITPFSMLQRYLSSSKDEYSIQGSDYIFPNWIAGMFMFFKRQNYALVNGFDERYFMYCEDCDLCFRLLRQGLRSALIPEVSIIHDARRSSRRKIKYLIWHITSLVRFYLRVLTSH